ncbi:MAG: alpha/beta hydrolase fold protein [Frankiales bacterium]|nr:alpha/beta hydrolase fold protein [Frankiales bacterium]
MSLVRVSDGVGLDVVQEGSGRPVVFMNGYGAAGALWAHQREALRAGSRVVVLDRRWHGASERPTHGQRMARHGKDVHDVLEALDLRDVLLVGASMGASTCLAYLDLFGSVRLRGVVLVDQTPKIVNEDGWELGMHGLTREGLEPFLAGFPGGLNPFHVVPEPEVLALGVVEPPFSVEQTRPLLRDHAEKDWRDVLPRVDVPLLAVAGRHSPFWPWESSAWMAEAAPLGELAVLDGSGHVPFLEEPEAFTAVLGEFAAR